MIVQPRMIVPPTREQLRFYANVDVDVFARGRFRLRQSIRNRVVTAGLNLAVGPLIGTSYTGINYLAFGTGATAVTIADTALVTEVFRDVLATRSQSGGVATFKYYLGSSSANGNTLAEIGLFNAAAGPTLFARALLTSTIAKTSSVTVTVTWTITGSSV